MNLDFYFMLFYQYSFNILFIDAPVGNDQLLEILNKLIKYIQIKVLKVT